MADLHDVERIAEGDNHLAVVATTRADGSVQASVVSAGVIDDPVDGSPGVGLVAAGGSVKLRMLRERPVATVVFKHGFQWAAVSGPARLVGPDDGSEYGLDVPQTIRSVFVAAGGDHEDWEEFDRVMADERRCAVFVRAASISTNSSTG
jgi:pyridoxamine 5'-phosphate oxidase-like protein